MQVPNVFAVLLADEKTKTRAQAFCARVQQQNFYHEEFIDSLLKRTAKQGLDSAEKTLERIIRHRPKKGEITILRTLSYQGQPYDEYVDITDGETVFTLQLPKAIAKQFHLNPYLKGNELYLDLTESRYKKVISSPQQFFNFLTVLWAMHTYVAGSTVTKIVEAYFQSPRKADALIERFSKDVERRREGDEIYTKLEHDGIVKIQDSFLVKPDYRDVSYDERKNVFAVLQDGTILTLEGSTPAKTKEILYRIKTKGLDAVKLTKNEMENQTLTAIASKLKTVAPALVLIILPAPTGQ
jgi:CRISPR/Cas system-associated protein endoribonuclease Cas2